MVKSLAAATVFLASVVSAGTINSRAAIDNYVKSERKLALKGVLANIGPDGALSTNASRGVVIGKYALPYMLRLFAHNNSRAWDH